MALPDLQDVWNWFQDVWNWIQDLPLYAPLLLLPLYACVFVLGLAWDAFRLLLQAARERRRAHQHRRCGEP